MKYLEIINKCLSELHMRTVSNFEELTRNDHEKIKDAVNVVNREICKIENWNFLLRKQQFTVSQNETEIQCSIEGRILYLLINGERYDYVQDFEPFLKGKAQEKTYSIFANKFLFPKSKLTRTATIVYYTNNCAAGRNGIEKSEMTLGDDESLIPMPFAQQLLVYGACLRFKANPQHFRFTYWLSMYKQALLNLRATACIDVQSPACIKLSGRSE